MNQFSTSVVLGALVIIFVTLHLVVTFTGETLCFFPHNEVESEHNLSANQGSTITQSKEKAIDRQGLPSRASRYMAPHLPAPMNTDASVILSKIHLLSQRSVFWGSQQTRV